MGEKGRKKKAADLFLPFPARCIPTPSPAPPPKNFFSNALLKEKPYSLSAVQEGLVCKGTGGELFRVLPFGVEYSWIFLAPSGLQCGQAAKDLHIQ